MLAGADLKAYDFLKMALDSLRVNKMRSALTMLGIIIGVASVTSLVSVGIGAQESITASFESMAPNVSFIQPSNANAPSGMGDAYASASLSMSDAEALEDIPGLGLVSATNGNFTEIKYDGSTKTSIIRGSGPDYLDLFGYTMATGHFINDANVARRDEVIVLGSKVVEDLFGDDLDVIGRQVTIRDKDFTVIGITAEKGGAMFGISMDDVAVVPITTYNARLSSTRTSQGEPAVDMIAVQFTDLTIKQGVIADIEAVLRRQHNLSDDDKNDFAISSPEQIIDQMQVITGVFTLFLGAIAAISLLVASIGIMNIMLVSVTERTREIGIRKAVGAKKRDILQQFLLEAGLLSMFGGFLGIAFGAVICYIISSIDMGGGSTINASLSPEIVIGVTLVSFLIGIVSGTYPAMRAARMDPIAALNYG